MDSIVLHENTDISHMKYLKYKQKYISLKNQTNNIQEQEGGLVSPGIYVVFFANPIKKGTGKRKIIIENDTLLFNDEKTVKRYDINNFLKFAGLSKIFGINSYSLKNNK